MPRACSRRRVRLVWHRRASALRRCARTIFSEVRFTNACGGLRFNHQNGISAATAVWTWHSVRSGFFPPEVLSHSRQEQVAGATQDQVSFQSSVAPTLILVQTDLTFLVLETSLHSPPREGYQQHRLERCSGGCV